MRSLAMHAPKPLISNPTIAAEVLGGEETARYNYFKLRLVAIEMRTSVAKEAFALVKIDQSISGTPPPRG